MYKPYDVQYVKRLERAVGLLGFLLATLVPVTAYLLTSKLVGASTDIPAPAIEEEQKLPTEVRIKQLTQAKIDSQIRSFIKKMNPKLSYTEVDKIARLEQKYSRQYGVPLEIGLAITMQESGFRPNATSPTGPVGLKQIASTYWAVECGTTKQGLYSVEQNIKCGYHILAKHYRQTQDWKAVLKRYYGGTAEENQKYMLTVLKKSRKMLDITT